MRCRAGPWRFSVALASCAPKRIAQVQKLLRTGSSLAEASFTCGFFDQSHMTRAFKKVVGITPGSFRNSSA
nr:helix-turn-helix domain-containing protein [Pseudomonas grimontii]